MQVIKIIILLFVFICCAISDNKLKSNGLCPGKGKFELACGYCKCIEADKRPKSCKIKDCVIY